MKNRLSALLMIASFVTGCASSHTTVYEDARSISILNTIAGTPYSGYLGAVATIAESAEYIMKIGKPKLGEISPGLLKHNRASPLYLGKWVPKMVNGVMLTEENTPQISRDYTITTSNGIVRLLQGDFGDAGEESLKKNVAAWRDGGLVVAEYHGPNGTKVIAVSNHNDAFGFMTYEEWTERLKGANK